MTGPIYLTQGPEGWRIHGVIPNNPHDYFTIRDSHAQLIAAQLNEADSLRDDLQLVRDAYAQLSTLVDDEQSEGLRLRKENERLTSEVDLLRAVIEALLAAMGDTKNLVGTIVGHSDDGTFRVKPNQTPYRTWPSAFTKIHIIPLPKEYQ